MSAPMSMSSVLLVSYQCSHLESSEARQAALTGSADRNSRGIWLIAASIARSRARFSFAVVLSFTDGFFKEDLSFPSTEASPTADRSRPGVADVPYVV